MRRLFAVAFGVLLGAAAMFIAFRFHVVRANDNWVFVRKPEASLVDAYIDVREWDSAEWMKHTALVKALIRTGQADLVRKSVTAHWMDKVFGKQHREDEPRESDAASIDWPQAERE